MNLIVRLNPLLARNSLPRNMSSLARGRVLEGNYWKYRIVDDLKEDDTHSSTVFKAEVIPHKNVQHAPKWFVVQCQPASIP